MWLGVPRTLCERIIMFDKQKAYRAIREAMEETVATLGISAVRALSSFPSALRADVAKTH